MNVLGHPFVAYKVLGDLNKWIVAGSWLPDLVPFVPDSVFEFEEIHEGGERFLRFLDQHYPDKRGLALGMLTHSVKFGADKFSRDIEKRFESVREKLAQMISESAGVSLEVAYKGWFHNYLWWGVDIQILRHEKEFVQRMTTTVPQIDIAEISGLLATCLSKEESDVRRMLDWVFEPLTPENLSTVRGLARIWKKAVVGLPEQSRVDVGKTVEVFNFCADLLKDDWRDILEEVIKEVGKNVERFK